MTEKPLNYLAKLENTKVKHECYLMSQVDYIRRSTNICKTTDRLFKDLEFMFSGGNGKII